MIPPLGLMWAKMHDDGLAQAPGRSIQTFAFLPALPELGALRRAKPDTMILLFMAIAPRPPFKVRVASTG